MAAAEVGDDVFGDDPTLTSLEEIAAGIADLEGDERVRVVIIDAAGRHFSAGGDMAFLDALADYEPFEIKRTVYRFFGAAVRADSACRSPSARSSTVRSGAIRQASASSRASPASWGARRAE